MWNMVKPWFSSTKIPSNKQLIPIASSCNHTSKNPRHGAYSAGTASLHPDEVRRSLPGRWGEVCRLWDWIKKRQLRYRLQNQKLGICGRFVPDCQRFYICFGCIFFQFSHEPHEASVRWAGLVRSLGGRSQINLPTMSARPTAMLMCSCVLSAACSYVYLIHTLCIYTYIHIYIYTRTI